MLPLWAFGASTTVQDARDTKGLLDVRKVKVEGKRKQPRWTFVTFKQWTKGRVYDRGYAAVFIDTFDDPRSDYYALVRSTGLEIEALLVRDRKKKSDVVLGSLEGVEAGRRQGHRSGAVPPLEGAAVASLLPLVGRDDHDR